MNNSIEHYSKFLRVTLKQEGLYYLLKRVLLYIINLPTYLLLKLKGILSLPKVFYFNNKEYKYFNHLYNLTWTNERSIEIPIVKEILGTYSPRDVLEVGNVLSHYFNCTHDIIDLTEVSKKVILRDIETFIPERKYKLVISISTFEHIGFWDTRIYSPLKLLRTLSNIKTNILQEGGKLIVIIPLGFNKGLDTLLLSSNPFKTIECMYKQKSKWIETSWDLVSKSRNFPLSSTNSKIILICTLTKES